jgi:hypothetical protein
VILTPSKISRYIKDLGISYRENSKSFMFNCPLCGGRDKLYIRKSDGRFRCFRCVTDKGFAGNIEYAIIELTDLSLKVVRQGLYGSEQEQSGFMDLKFKDFFDETENEDLEVEEDLPELTWPYHCIPILHKGAKNGQNYLQSRGISLEVADSYKIRYSPQNRAVVFPVYVGEALLGWQYRTIDKTKFLVDDVVKELPKAWSSPNLPRDKVFMFSNRLVGAKAAVICEGPIDALKADFFGGNIATMGKSISLVHIAILLRSGIKNVYSGLDPDAFAELDPLLTKLGDDINLFYVKLPEVKGEKVDLGRLSMEEAYRVILSSERMTKGKMYVWFNPFVFDK